MQQFYLELQKEICNSSIPTTDILRKALLIARNLNLKKFENWILQELNGYQCKVNEVPEYRKVACTLQALNPLYGWVNVTIVEPQLIKQLSKKFQIIQPIPEIETAVQKAKESGHIKLQLELSPEQEITLMQMIHPPSRPRLMLDITHAHNILEAVRTRTADWLWEMQEGKGKKGILQMLGGVFPQLRREGIQQAKTIEPYGDPMTVFISYSRKDEKWMVRLKSALEKQGIPVIIDEIALQFGDNIEANLKQLVRETAVTISIISQNSLLSDWVGIESVETLLHERFENKQTKFLPVIIDKQIMEDSFYIAAIEEIDKNINRLQELTNKATRLNVTTKIYDAKRARLGDLRKNLDEILTRIRESVAADFTSEEKIKQNLSKLLDVLVV